MSVLLVTGHPDAARVLRCSDVRFGSSTDLKGPKSHFRFTPKSGHACERQLCARSGRSIQVSFGPVADISTRTPAIRALPFPNDSCKWNLSRVITSLLEDDLPFSSVQYFRKHTAFAAVWRADVQNEGDRPAEVNYFRIPVLAGLDPAWSVHRQRHVGVIRPGRSVR